MSSDFWRAYQFRLETWGTDNESPIRWTEEEGATVEPVDLTVESNDWQPRRPSQLPHLPEKIIFVDGRRRLDARFLGREGNEIRYGAFATLAVGAVLVDRIAQRATCLETIIKRAIALGGNLAPPVTHIPCPLGSPAQLTYDLCLSASENTPQQILALVQQAMLKEEVKLAEQLSRDLKSLVIRDGPLRYSSYPELTLGYIKTMGKIYLTGDSAQLLWQLELGERTPIFAIGEGSSSKRRWSWYLRSGHRDLVPKQLGYHDLHGIVRLDLYSEVPLEKAKELADISTWLIPQYASHPTHDSRAPQNLTPVGALERELGRRMGERTVIERRLRSFLIN